MMCLIYWVLDKKFGSYILLSYSTGRLINCFAKVTACVYRPWIRDARIEPVASAKSGATGYSFPSGHTGNATIVYGGIASRKDSGKFLRVLMLLIVYAACKPYPIDYDAAGNILVLPKKMAVDAYKNAGIGIGIYLGWFLERRFVKFSTEGTTWQEKSRKDRQTC